MGLGISFMPAIIKEGPKDNQKITAVQIPAMRSIALLLPILIAVIVPNVLFTTKFTQSKADTASLIGVSVIMIIMIIAIFGRNFLVNMLITKNTKGLETATDEELENVKKFIDGEALIWLLFMSISVIPAFFLWNLFLNKKRKFFGKGRKLETAGELAKEVQKLADDLDKAADQVQAGIIKQSKQQVLPRTPSAIPGSFAI